MTFSGPCIVIYSCNESQRDALILTFILIHRSKCFGQTYCVHHQESWYCIHSNWYLSYWNFKIGKITSVCVYTECPRRNVPDFGRVFLMLNYTDITQNTYVQSWTVTEIKAREKCGLLEVLRTVPGSRDVIPIRCALSVLVYSRLKRVPCCDFTCKVLGNPKDNYDMSASVFVVQFNGFVSLSS